MKNLFIIGLVALAACSEMDQTDQSPQSLNTKDQKLQNTKAREPNDYLANLDSLNGSVSGFVTGNANFKKLGNDFIAYIRIFNAVPGLIHEQRFYQASSCPRIEDDLNGDGFIDIQELNSFLGNPIFPLDADITSQAAGAHTFPAGDQVGGYWYEQIVPMDVLMSDLHAEDLTPEDDFVPLPMSEQLSLDEGVVVILGVPAATYLPETVASSAGYANFQTLPIACGSLRKIYQVPGRIESDKADAISEGEVGGVLGEYDNAPILHHTERKSGNYGDDDI